MLYTHVHYCDVVAFILGYLGFVLTLGYCNDAGMVRSGGYVKARNFKPSLVKVKTFCYN